jgi:hypothetical protein
MALRNDPGLAGQAFDQQGFVTDPGFNSLGLIASNAAEAVIGRRQTFGHRCR